MEECYWAAVAGLLFTLTMLGLATRGKYQHIVIEIGQSHFFRWCEKHVRAVYLQAYLLYQ